MIETKEAAMKVFVVGASGALGKQLIPRLVAAGNDVTGTTTSDSKRALVESLGARAVVLDLLDANAVAAVVREAAPEVVVHEATALAGNMNFRNFDSSFERTNRLRIRHPDQRNTAGGWKRSYRTPICGYNQKIYS